MAACLNLVLCFFLIYHTHAQAIGNSVTQIKYQTGPDNGGDAAVNLTLTLHWNTHKYTWISNPTDTNNFYQTNSPSPSSDSVNPSIPYYFEIEWNGAPLQITHLKVTDNSGSFYTIDNFCIAPKMQHTLDREESITPDSMSPCNQWSSKDSYDHIQLGTGTKYTKLYVDIPIFGSRFANKVVEGGVRPPNLLSVGFQTGTGAISAGETVGISVQWDVAIYRCDDIEPFTNYYKYTCSVSAVFCPGLTSDFWLSIHSPLTGTDILPVDEITFADETGTEYIFTNFCREEGTQTGSNCPDTSFGSSYKEQTAVYVGAFDWPQLVPFLVPDSVFDYPDVTPNPEYVAVLEGSSPSGSAFGWDSGQYGATDLTCPETSLPTSDPTISPTTDPPTAQPTSGYPTKTPTSDPSQPTTNPTKTPTISLISDPPIYDPTPAPTNQPTADPTNAPTYPTTDPTAIPLLSSIFNKSVYYIIITICLCSICIIVTICICICLIYKLIKEVQKSNLLSRKQMDNDDTNVFNADDINKLFQATSQHDERNYAEDTENEDENVTEGRNIILDAMKNDKIALGIVSTRRGTDLEITSNERVRDPGEVPCSICSYCGRKMTQQVEGVAICRVCKSIEDLKTNSENTKLK